MESINVTFDEDGVLASNDEDLESLKLETEAEKDTDKIVEQEATINEEKINNDHQDIPEQQQEAPPRITKEWIQKNHPSKKIIGDINEGQQLCSSQKVHVSFLATFEPSSFEEASQNEHWVTAMNE